MNKLRRIAGRLVRLLQGKPEASVETRLAALEAEIIELRRDNLRIAELTDLVETLLTPGQTQDPRK